MKRLAALTLIALGGITAFFALPPSYLEFSRHFPLEVGYNPVDDVKARWPDVFYANPGRFTGSQSRAESADIKRMVDLDAADQPQRRQHIQAALVVDLAALACFLLFLALKFIRPRAGRISNAAMDVAADGVRAARTVKSTAQAIGTKIKQRADDRTK